MGVGLRVTGLNRVLARSGLWFLAAGAALTVGCAAAAEVCPVVKAHTPSAAEQAFLAADYENAAKLYLAELGNRANSPELTEGLVRVLLRAQKVQEASNAVTAALAANPGSALLLTAKAEVELRQGAPWDATRSITAAFKADPCVPRVHLVLSDKARLNSMYATARAEVLLAHRLDPDDPDIRRAWIGTLPLRERALELERYLSTPTGDDADERHREQLWLEHLKKQLNEPRKACRLDSTATSTEIPFAELLYDANHIRAFGLQVKMNQHASRLEIDTGAGGLVVSRTVAQHAGLKPFSETEIGGIGDKKNSKGYAAYADSIQIGNLEFHDCMIEVVDNIRMMDIDGLIGMDVFSSFLVTLNYPGHKLKLDPLPSRPGEAVTAPTLGTSSSRDEDEAQDEDGATSASKAGKTAETGGPAVPGNAVEPAQPKPDKGPFNRYIAPEMADYTPVYRVGHNLMLPVALNSSKLKLFVLDTGAWSTTISPSAAREITKVRSNDTLHVRGLNGEVEKAFTADEVTFAFAKVSQRIERVPSFDTAKISKGLGLEVSGFLGARTLELTTIHIDYRDGLVKFDYDPKAVVTVHAQD